MGHQPGDLYGAGGEDDRVFDRRRNRGMEEAGEFSSDVTDRPEHGLIRGRVIAHHRAEWDEADMVVKCLL